MTFIEQLLTGPLHRVSHVTRYSSQPVILKENVAEHSFYVALYALMVAEYLEDVSIDIGTLLRRALCHDLDESVTGDFQRKFKYSHPELKETISKYGGKFMCAMLEDYEKVVGDAIYFDWHDAKDDTTEGQIISVADYLAVVAYIIREHRLGNRYIQQLFCECGDYGRWLREEVAEAPLVHLITESLTFMSKVRREHNYGS